MLGSFKKRKGFKTLGNRGCIAVATEQEQKAREVVTQEEALAKTASEKHTTPRERETRVRRTETEILWAYGTIFCTYLLAEDWLILK